VQFVPNGPDIPDALLQAHEEGRVVFFCGAGISYPAGLPGFKELVRRLYEGLGVTPDAVQEAALKAGQFDIAVNLLEDCVAGGRDHVRGELVRILKPDITAKNSTKTHEALLTLSKCRKGPTRLITTNFDRLFEEVIAEKSLPIERFRAPLLPVPKNVWDGLVYLHGLIAIEPISTDLNRLVVSSGDFGLAYLTERWASRFVSELFRNYSVCFVGYSINDPVLRYMMDALAVDRQSGEVRSEMFAFGSYSRGREKESADFWRSRKVTPILYREHNRHAYLHQTLHAWAITYRDGVQGKEAIVAQYALLRPQASTKQDDFVKRMLWALSDPSGLPARRFAQFNPAPSLEWLLEAFTTNEHFGRDDLLRFGVPPHEERNDKLQFSLVDRPAPYDLAPPMRLVSNRNSEGGWDEVMHQLARWLVRHLDDPRLVIWIAKRGGQLHPRWLLLIESTLKYLVERKDATAELDGIRLNAPKAIPSPPMRTLWQLLLRGRVKSARLDFNLYDWSRRLDRDGLNSTLRLELRQLLQPKVVLKDAFRSSSADSGRTDEPTRVTQLVRCELELAADNVYEFLRQKSVKTDEWISALPSLLEDFQQLLRDALDLLSELNADTDDHSHWYLPSITPHSQNRGFNDWVSLIELLRDAWLAVCGNDKARATRIAQSWFEVPYPSFKRLALFAASQDDCIAPVQWVEWLLADDAAWLWSSNTRRELCRLFVLQGMHLSGAAQKQLEATILAGPPLETYLSVSEEHLRKTYADRDVWLRLAKLHSSGIELNAPSASRLEEISVAYPDWKLATNDRNEFSSWMSGSGDPDFEDIRQVDIAPRKRRDLVLWLTKPTPERRPFNEDTWPEVCRTRFFHGLSALCDLAKKGEWPTGRWREALQVWAEPGMVSLSWRYVAPMVQTMPDLVLQQVDYAVTWWIKSTSTSTSAHEEILLHLSSRVLGLPLELGPGSRRIHNDGSKTYDPADSAVNHPIGHITQALINLWFKRNPNDNDQLPADLKPLFTSLCDVQVERFRHGRVVMALHLIAFFRGDPDWTKHHLLPLLSWSNPIEANALWQGFLTSPRLYPPLMTAFKHHFLRSANHYADLGDCRQEFASFLTYAALDMPAGYTAVEFQEAIKALPKDGLEVSARQLLRALGSAAEQRENYWNHRVKPFWQKIWPKTLEKATARIANDLSKLAITARGEFPAAMDAVQYWLQPVDHLQTVVPQLHESGLCKLYPEASLKLLSKVIDNQLWAPEELGQCLDEIVQANPNLSQDARYVALQNYFRSRRD
jgi:hypothetical protein